MSEFNPDGPHSPELTREAAGQIAELARFLNYCTLRDAPGLDFPADLGSVIASLASAAERLPQFLGQSATWLEARSRGEGAYDSRGADPELTALRAAGQMGHAAHLAGELARALKSAQNETACLGVRDDDDA